MRVESILERVGNKALGSLERLGGFVLLFGSVMKLVASGRIHWRNAFQQMAFIGVESLPIALITAVSVGMVFTLQISNEFIRYGATSVIGGVSTIALVRELVPTLTGVVIAGRVGAAIAAELGTMKVTEQIDAIEASAVDSFKLLVVTRIVACVLMLPLLTIVADFSGIMVGWLANTMIEHVSLAPFLTDGFKQVTFQDLLPATLRTAIFGFIIGLLGCFQGMRTTGGTEGVARSATSAVVLSSLFVIVADVWLVRLIQMVFQP